MSSLEVDLRRLVRLAAISLLAIAAIGSGVLLLSGVVRQHHPFLYDFRGGLYNAGWAILHGHSPYNPGFLLHQAAVMRSGGVAIGETTQRSFSIPLYPAPANIAVVPLSLLPFWLAAAVFTAFSIAAMIVGLRLLGIRDWRCFALALLSWPFVYSVDLGALGPLILLGAALIWRFRARVVPPALALGSIVAVKIFPWTLGFWLLSTKRYRALAASLVFLLTITIGAWALTGFDGMAQYPQMLANASLIQEGRGTSLVALLLAIGLTPAVAHIVALLAAAALVAVAWRIALRPSGERAAFGLIVIAALTASPLVWDHYLVLLFVPIALISRRPSLLWLLPGAAPLLYAISVVAVPLPDTGAGSIHDVRAAVVWLLLEAVVTVWLCASARPPRATMMHAHSGEPRSVAVA